MLRPLLLLLAFTAALAPGRARACSVCGCGDPLVAASEARPISGWLRLALDFEYLTAEARSDEQPALTESLTQLTIRPVVIVSPTDSLNLVLQVPFVYKDWSLGGAGGSVASAKPFGLGDIDFGVRWFLLDRTDLRRQRRWNLALSAGSSFPTGADDERVHGVRIDDHAQLGTGAFGPYGGALYAWHQDPWNLFVTASYRTHTTNSYGYRFGEAVLFSVRGELRPWERLAFGLGLDGRWAARDTLSGERQENTGGLLLALTPGVIVNLVDPGLWLQVRVQVPVLSRLYGEQSVGPVVTASLQYAFAKF
ncbi:MAG TPA: hypothetical protein VGQ83_30310 [Polyangia bacterium]|jgi:hypothetical protein